MNIAVAALLAAFLTAAPGTWSPGSPAVTDTVTAAPAPATPAASAGFTVRYYDPETQDFMPFKTFLSNWGGVDAVAARLTGALALPQTVLIAFGECGESNAFYESNRNRVVICYDLFGSLLGVYSQVAETDEEMVQSATGALLWITLHEAGHALVDLLDLPLTGREEDAADQFALFVLLPMEGGAQAAALGAAALLDLSGSAEDLGPAGYWDEHSLAEQRFANVMCWIYGSDPGAYSNLADVLVSTGASDRRLGRCKDEYNQMVDSWLTLLGPYLIRTRGGETYTLPAIPKHMEGQ